MIDMERLKQIPVGPYCHDATGMPCPFWGRRSDMPRQQSGFCTLLDLKDWEGDGIPLLWDQVKECGIRED